MEKWQSELKQDNVKECGTKYLNNVLNYKDKLENLMSSFYEDYLKNINNNKEDALQTLEHFKDLAQMLIYTFEIYYDNVKKFETEILQINSIISSSLLVEQQIHDILYNKDLTLLSSNETEAEKWQNIIDMLETSIKQLEEGKKQILLPVADSTHNLLMQSEAYRKELKEQLEQMLQQTTQYYKDAEKQERANKNKIAELKKDYYFIGKLSKDKGFYKFFTRAFTYVVFNDLLEKIREHYFKEYSIKLNVKSIQLTYKTKPCLDIVSYIKACSQLASTIDLSLLNSGGIIPTTALSYYNNFLYLKDNTKKQSYIRAINRYSKDAIRELDTILNFKAPSLYDIVLDRTQRLLTELRWCDFEE